MCLTCSKNLLRLHQLQNVSTHKLLCEMVPDVVCKPNPINPHNLPLLPIPKLEHTLSKFLKSAEPFVTPCELTTARDICRKFWKHDGYQIQQLLIQRARDHPNWLDEWYLKCSYLCHRTGLPMNTSPVVIFPTETFKSRCDQLNYAAKLIQGVLKFKKKCQDGKISLETWGRHPFYMGTYKKLFSYTRLPKVGCDTLERLKEDSKHIIVVYNNNFFKLTVLNEAFKPLSFTQLLTRLEDVVEYGGVRGEPFGILTSMKRDRWAKVYESMKGIKENAKNFEEIENALFVVCLDECSDSKVDARLNACLNGFHGHGVCVNAANRWYDKTLQFFVNLDGSVGLIFEHSPTDATPLTRMTDFLISYIKGDEWMNIPFVNFCENPKPLCFVCTQDAKYAIEDGCADAQMKTNTFSCHLAQYDKYGKDFCKDHDVSADAIVQIAIQMAHLNVHGNYAPHQEVVTTRKFFRGRNDIVRSCTCEMIRFIKSVDDPLIFLIDRYDFLQEAVRVHRALSVDAMEGKAIDCHLFGLMMACREAGLYLPKVFFCNAYLKSSRFKILSMQAPMESDSFMCFPPSCHGGYGICYNPRKGDFNICVTSKRDDCDTKPKKLLEHWCCCMKRLADILCGFERRKKKLID